MRKFLWSPFEPDDLGTLLKWNIGVCVAVFIFLQFWRPYFFLTDDNLSGSLPLLTEIGRHLKSGQSPFISHYIYGGHYDLSRDIAVPYWHPFYILPSLLADTPGRYAILDVTALCFLLLTTVGFTFLAAALVRNFDPRVPSIYIIFYTGSFLFSSYILTVGSSWIQFLGNQSALPWLALGILERRLVRGTLLVLFFSLHEIFSSYPTSTVFDGIYLSVFALGLCFVRRSPGPMAAWVCGNLLAIFVALPFLLHVLDGFAHAIRITGMTMRECVELNIPAKVYVFSFFGGNWTRLAEVLFGYNVMHGEDVPFASSLLACGAAWCLWPMLLNRRPWRGMELLCLALIVSLVLLTIRPAPLEEVLYRLPFVKSTRWPFREGLQLLFFFHLLLLLRPQGYGRVSGVLAIFSFLVFVLPVRFARLPSLNPLAADRVAVLSGQADLFWARMKSVLGPDAAVGTVIDRSWWDRHYRQIPYSLTGTANFPALYRFKCISGYSPTAPADEVALKTRPAFWFGAFETKQMALILREKPDLSLIVVEKASPLRLSLRTKGKTIDLTPFLPP